MLQRTLHHKRYDAGITGGAPDALTSLYYSAGLRVGSGAGLMRWAHEQGHFQPLRRHPNSTDYYDDMSKVSRARQFLGRIFTADKADMNVLPNEVVWTMARMVPAAARSPYKPIDRELHRARLTAWLELESRQIGNWAAQANTSVTTINSARTKLVELAQGSLTLNGLKARAVELLSYR